MKERPILFSGPMVRAILDGRKTMTRRVVRMHRDCHEDRELRPTPNGLDLYYPDYPEEGVLGISCPYGKPGDRLWVRETWKYTEQLHGPCIRYRAGGIVLGIIDGKTKKPDEKWRPSIYMPRWASRILLEIVSIRVERVQDISEADAKAEGAEAKRWQDLRLCPMSLLGGAGSVLTSEPQYRYGFFELWDSINAARGYGWDANPWVWVVEFKRI